MHRVAPRGAQPSDCGLADAEPADRRLARAHGARGLADMHFAAETRDAAGAQLEARFVRHQLPPLDVVRFRQQLLAGHFAEIRIAIELLAIRERELRALYEDMDEIRS